MGGFVHRGEHHISCITHSVKKVHFEHINKTLKALMKWIYTKGDNVGEMLRTEPCIITSSWNYYVIMKRADDRDPNGEFFHGVIQLKDFERGSEIAIAPSKI